MLARPDIRSRKKKDDVLRKKVEQELSKKKSPMKRKASLRSLTALLIQDTARVIQAAQLMAAKRSDAVLVVNEMGGLVGVLTDKDIAYRVVAANLDINLTLVSQVMTKDPISFPEHGNHNEALNLMISKKFRHLPIVSEGQVVGMLDITKCVFERLEDLEKKVTEDTHILSAMEALERRGATVNSSMYEQHGCPLVSSVIKPLICEISVKSTVYDAAVMMKEMHTTAVICLSGNDLAGIFTTKDVVLRVMAAGLDPMKTSLVRVMTPHPDSISPNATILDALKKLKEGHYLHLPVVTDVPVGMADVMSLTISMLTYLMSKDGMHEDVWNNFWNSYPESESDHGRDSLFERSSFVEKEERKLAFKLKANNQVFRMTSGTTLNELLDTISTRTGYSVDENSLVVAGLKYKISFRDEDGDFCTIETNKDVDEAFSVSKKTSLTLYVGTPTKDYSLYLLSGGVALLCLVGFALLRK